MKKFSLHSEWELGVEEYIGCLKNDISLSSGEGDACASKMASLLVNLCQLFVVNGRIKDTWSQIKCGVTSNGVYAIIMSVTQNHQYTVGVFNDEVYISSSVLEAQNIKNMSDDFWECFSEITKIGRFEFQENAGLPSSLKSQYDLRTCRSSIYKLIRNFVLFEEHSSRDTQDLGFFEFRWDISEPIEQVLQTGTEAFKKIHKLNYFLYRCQYLKNNSRQRSNKKRI